MILYRVQLYIAFSLVLILTACSNIDRDVSVQSGSDTCLKTTLGADLYYVFAHSSYNNAEYLMQWGYHSNPQKLEALVLCFGDTNNEEDESYDALLFRAWNFVNKSVLSEEERVWLSDFESLSNRLFFVNQETDIPRELRLKDLVAIVNSSDFYLNQALIDGKEKQPVLILDKSLNGDDLTSHAMRSNRRLNYSLVLQILYESTGALCYLEAPNRIILYHPNKFDRNSVDDFGGYL